MHPLLLGLTTLVLAMGLNAQTKSLIFAMDGDELTLRNGGGLAATGEIQDDEAALVTPSLSPYSALPFLTIGAQWTWLGDADNDGRYADSSTSGPGGDTDVVFVKRGTQGRLSARDVYFSKASETDFGSVVKDGDVFRYVGAGKIEKFLSEDQLGIAIGGSSTTDTDIDALAQWSRGDLFFSFADTETVNNQSVNDGALLYIPFDAITYDASGNVSAIKAGSAVLLATEAEMKTIVAASKVLTSVGGAPAYTELSALEIDPAGGTWNPPQDPKLSLPNLLFAWNGYSNDGAVLSTRGGGTIAMINGVPLGSTVATTGTQIGMLPDSTGLGGVNGLAVVDEQAERPAVEVWANYLVTSLPAWRRVEFSGGTPSSAVVVLLTLGPSAAGGAAPMTALSPFGNLYGDLSSLLLLGAAPTNSQGLAHRDFLFVSPALKGTNLIFQSFDLGKLELSEPTTLQFL